MVRNPPANAGDLRDTGPILGQGDPLGEGMATPPVFLSGESHGQRGLGCYSPGDTKSWTPLK